MEDKDARTGARIATARTFLELAGDIGKHSKSQLNYEQNLAEMTPAELSAIYGRWEDERYLIRILNLSDKGICLIFLIIEHLKIGFYIQLSDIPTNPLPYSQMSQLIDCGLKNKTAMK